MGNIENARDLGAGIYTQAEVDAGYTPKGFKNYIINGGFDVWQRGTSFSSSAQYFSADRWRVNDCPSSRVIADDKIWLSLGTATDTNAYIHQRIENGWKLQNKTMTFSFEIKNGINLGEAFVSYQVGANAQVNLTSIDFTTDGQKSVTFTVNDYASTSDFLEIQINVNASTIQGSVDITNIQLEEGSVATPFEQRPYGLELSLCQRYYEKTFVSYASELPNLIWNSGTVDYSLAVGREFAVRKRTTPTMTIYSGNGDGIANNVMTGYGRKGVTQIVDVGEKGFGRIYHGAMVGSSWQSYHYVADAEL